jgi:hypothetical protein
MSVLRHRVLLPAASAELPLRQPGYTSSRKDSGPSALLSPVLYAWTCAGLLSLILFPGLRGADPVIGWWPFWLLLWPLSSMLLLGLCRQAKRQTR